MEQIFGILEKVNYLLIFIALGLNVHVVRSFGKGILNVLFISFGFSIFFFGSAELFAYFKHSGVYELSEATGHIWWHILVNLSLFSLVWGGYRIKSISTSENPEGFGRRDINLFATLFVVMLGVFVLTPVLEGVLSTNAVSIFIDSYGVHHLSVFILGALGGWYLFYVRGQWGLLGSSILAMIAFIVLIGGQHFWETITETYKVIVLDDETIEGIELLFVFPALLSLVFAQWKLFKYVQGMKTLG